MSEQNEEFKPNPQINTTNVFLLAILVCLLFLCFYISHANKSNIESNKKIGSLQHYDSLYSERQGHISIDQNSNIIGYVTPDGTNYYFENPIPSEIFYND